MAKKKNIPKKHRFKHVEGVVPSAVGSDESKSSASSPNEIRQVKPMAVTAAGRDFSYVTGDLRRIGIMAIILIGIELVFYYLLTHTTLGSLISNL